LAIGDEAMTRVRIVRATIALSLALAILVLEWVWRHRTYEDLEQRDGKCVVVGETVNNGRVPVVPCQEEGARTVRAVVGPNGDCPDGTERVRVRTELSHDTGYVGTLCLEHG